MIKHIVMWKVKEKALGKTKEENIAEIKCMLMNLKQYIPELIDIEVGINIESLTGLHDIALTTTFKDEDGLNAYQSNPRHVELATHMRQVVTDRTCVDYKVGES